MYVGWRLFQKVSGRERVCDVANQEAAAEEPEQVGRRRTTGRRFEGPATDCAQHHRPVAQVCWRLGTKGWLLSFCSLFLRYYQQYY